MKLTQYQIDLFGFDTIQAEFINSIIGNAFSQGVIKGIEEIQALKDNQ